MKMILKNTLSLLLLVTLVACQHEADTETKAEAEVETVAAVETAADKADSHMVQEKIPTEQGEYWQGVTVIYNDFEGGFYGLVNGAGKKLLPMNLAQEYKVNGTKLRVKGHIIKDMMSIQQWGTAFKITEVELVSLGKNKQRINTF